MSGPDAPAHESHKASLHRMLNRALGIMWRFVESGAGIQVLMQTEGIQGELCSAHDDAVAQFLTKSCDGNQVYVGLTSVLVFVDDYAVVDIPTPDWLQQFIRNYDMEMFPDIVREGSNGRF